MSRARARSSICSRSRRASRSAGPVRLVDDEHVGHLQEPGLVGLHGVAPPRGHHDDGRVGGRRDLDLHLADADRLDDDDGDARRAEKTNGVGDRQRQPAEVPSRRHGTDEDRRIEGVTAHPHTVAEDGAAAERRRRVDRQHADLRHALCVWFGPSAARGADEAVGERRLARARRAGQAERVGRRRTVGQGAPRPSPPHPRPQ